VPTWLDDELWFPPVETADDDGLLAVGGDLTAERLLLAYENGIFPWFNDDDPPLWWSPDPRFALLPQNLKVSSSMKQVLRSGKFEFKMNTAFGAVIDNCALTLRKGQEGGTWITEDIRASYKLLHKMNIAHSAEAWVAGELVGGLYGVWLGNVFFGESMFSKVSNASKFAFIKLTELLISSGVVLIDCQVFTQHLASLGAAHMPRTEFIEILQKEIK
jgi:leucyl/phenylalanyl-tRNA---protein transferase